MLRLALVTLELVLLLLLEEEVVQAAKTPCLNNEHHWRKNVVREIPSSLEQLTAGLASLRDEVDAPPQTTQSNSTALIVGGAVGCLVFLAVIGGLAIVLGKRRRARASVPALASQARCRPSKLHAITSLSGAASAPSPAGSYFSAYDDPFSSSGVSSCGPCSSSGYSSSSSAKFKTTFELETPPHSSYIVAPPETPSEEEDLGTSSPFARHFQPVQYQPRDVGTGVINVDVEASESSCSDTLVAPRSIPGEHDVDPIRLQSTWRGHLKLR